MTARPTIFFNPVFALIDNMLVFFTVAAVIIFSLYLIIFLATVIVVFLTILFIQLLNINLTPATVLVTAFSLFQYTVDVIANLLVLTMVFILWLLNQVIVILHAFNLFPELQQLDITTFQLNGVHAITQILDFPYQYISQIFGVPYQVIF